jgi:acyl-CoA thioesterase
MPHPKRSPFVEHVGVVIEEQRAGFSRCALAVAPHHFNTLGVVHGGVMFTLADTGMGAALIPDLQEEPSTSKSTTSSPFSRVS